MRFTFFLALLCVLQPKNGQAYFDPGTGSLIIQAVIAGIAGALVALRAFRYKISAFLRGDRSSEDAPSEKPSSDDEKE